MHKTGKRNCQLNHTAQITLSLYTTADNALYKKQEEFRSRLLFTQTSSAENSMNMFVFMCLCSPFSHSPVVETNLCWRAKDK